MFLNLRNMSLYVRPQAWWTPIGLLAVIGPSMNEYLRSESLFRSRYFRGTSFWFHQSIVSRSIATKSTRELTGSNIRYHLYLLDSRNPLRSFEPDRLHFRSNSEYLATCHKAPTKEKAPVPHVRDGSWSVSTCYRGTTHVPAVGGLSRPGGFPATRPLV